MAQQAARPRTVVGVDGTEASVRAVRWALEYARATGAVVEAVHAWEPPSQFGIPLAVLPRVNRAAAAEQLIAAVVDRAAGGEPGVAVERRPVRGEPGPALVDRSRHADLLVVGSHGLPGLLGTMTGSVSLYCVDHATCPVVVVKATT
ncbi:MAG: universal stress protein [Micromonosporaceae bacterium]